MNETPPRAWFRFHLSTAVALMFFAAALLWANIARDGWPRAARVWYPDESTTVVFALDAGLCVALLAFAGAVAELLARGGFFDPPRFRKLLFPGSGLVVLLVAVGLLWRAPITPKGLLLSAVAGSDRIRINAVPGGLLKDLRVVEVTDRSEIDALLEQIEFSHVGGVCCCLGNEQLTFFRGSSFAGTVTLHHGTHLRGCWPRDAHLTDTAQQAVSAWLSKHWGPIGK
jgi:hypothetical protein